MNTQWIEKFVGKKHKHGVSNKELAEEMGCSENWVSEVLNYKRQAKNSQLKFEVSLDNIIKRKE